MAIAAVKSEISFVVNVFFEELAAPEPPCREEDALADLDLTFGRSSDITGPDADGGALCLGGAGDGLRDDAADARGEGSTSADRPPAACERDVDM